MPLLLRSRLIVIVLLLYCMAVVGARKQKQQNVEDEPPSAPSVHYLVEILGKEMYNAVNRPKYKFYIYMTVGKLPDEQSTIVLLATICNVLYGCCIWLGFMFLPRERMLIATALTFYVGPAIILILMGVLGLSLAAFAMYPVRSVMCIWLWFFLTSQAAQALGRYLGLDSDKDGDVDVLDVIHWMGSTRWGKFLGIPWLYAMLEDATMDPFKEINKRLDQITAKIEKDEQKSKGKRGVKKQE